MKRTNLFLFFIIPFAGVLILFFLFSSLNRAYIQRKVKELVQEQLQATASLLELSITPLLEKGYSAQEVLDIVASKEDIYYLALLDGERNIRGWRSQFEGYLPLSKGDISRKEPWIINSPAGSIFNLFVPLSVKTGENYLLYLGYSLGPLEEMLARSNRNFLLIFVLLIGTGVLFFLGLFELQKNYLAKVREVEKEKKDKERFREMSAFTSAVAHEIKNPLNSFSLLCELILRKGPPEARAMAVQAKAEISHFSEIIDRFNAYVKPLALKKKKFPLKEVVLSAWNSVATGSQNSDVVFNYLENTPLILYADKNLIFQVFSNLLKNALEATEKGEIKVETGKEKNRILIKITDTGKGMTSDELNQIFNPFFSTKQKGMGIGLYLVRKIIEAHQGLIEARSEPGQGTTFIIQLPGGRHE